MYSQSIWVTVGLEATDSLQERKPRSPSWLSPWFVSVRIPFLANWWTLNLPAWCFQKAWNPSPLLSVQFPCCMRLPAKGPISVNCDVNTSLVKSWIQPHLPNEALDYLIRSDSDKSVLVTSAIDWNTREKISTGPTPWHWLCELR